jgi:iron complex outermembrane receptor protein
MKTAAALAGACAISMVVGASAFGEGDIVMLDELVVKGKKTPPFEESLTIREVRESPARDVGEALGRVEGISFVRKGAIANDVVLRGFQRDNINVLIDGIRLHGACPNRMDPPAFHYDFAEIEQIKIVKGPYDLTNPGSMGGLVDVIGKKPQQGWGADLSVTGGSYDNVNTSAIASYASERFDGLLGYAFKYSGVPKSGNGKLITDIYLPNTPSYGSRYKPSALDSKAYEINTGWAKLGFNPTSNSRSEISYSYQDAEHVLYPALQMDAVYDRTHRLGWTYQVDRLSPLVQWLRLQAYWDKVDHLMDNHLRANWTMMPMVSDAQAKVYGAKATTSLAVGPGMLTGGLDYYNRNWDVITSIPDVRIDNIGVFAEYELPVGESLKVEGGMRGDFTWVDPDRANDATAIKGSATYGEVAGNLRLTWTPVAEVDLYTGIARGTRTPDPEELYVERTGMRVWRGNPRLRATANYEVDLGAKYATSRYYVDASFFYSYLNDFINLTDKPLPMDMKLMTYENIDATMWGAEAGAQYALPMDVFLKGSLSYTEGENRDGHRPLSEIPPLRGGVGVRYDNDTFFTEITETLAARQGRVDPVLLEQPTASYATTDLKGGFRYKALSVYAGINNLLDAQYFNYLSYQRNIYATGLKVPENGRNFYVTAQYSF